MSLVSVAIPIFNEEKTLPSLFERLRRVAADLTHDVEFVFIDDGSTDGSHSLLRELAATDSRVRVVRLSRNFGHQAACTAGLRYSRGDAVVLMDGDLQDPPEVIPQLIRVWEQGYRIVAARRRSRGETGLRKGLITAFYRVFAYLSDVPIPAETGIFGLLDRAAAAEVAQLPERNRYLPGLRWWIGHTHGEVWYERGARYAGRPKQDLARLFAYAADAIFSFSYKPLRLATLVGVLVSTLSFAYAVVLIVLRLLDVNVVLGFTTQTVAVLFLGGIQLTSIGILGEYMARTYDEVKQRPFYIVEAVFDPTAADDAHGAPTVASRDVDGIRGAATRRSNG